LENSLTVVERFNEKFGKIRMAEIDGKPYAIGIDIAKALEYAKPSQAVIDHCKGIRKLRIPSKGGIQETNVIPEGDIFRLITKASEQSKNPDIKERAEEFEKWIFDEVLPSIRQTGAYISDKADPEMLRKKADRIESLENINKSLEFLSPLLDYAGVDNTIKLLVAKSFFSKAGIDIPVDIQADQKYYDTKQIGNIVGMYSKSGKPAYMAVNEILKLLDIEESEKTAVWETNGAWQGTVTKYSDSVVNKVKEWLEENDHPADIPSKNKTFHVSYSGGVQL